MASDDSPGLRKDLRDDFYAECDELLGAIRQHLLALERSTNAGPPAPAALEALFRSMHTLKGISAIAGMRPAEELAHATEEVLRALTRNELPLTMDRLGLVLEAASLLEKTIGAHRAERRLPTSRPLLERLAGDLQKRTTSPASATPADAPAAASADVNPVSLILARGLQPWRCTFAPAKELDERGINVTTVRERLLELGEIVSAAPNIIPGKGIRFVFILALRDAPANLAAWQVDGLSLEPISVAPPVARAAPSPLTRNDPEPSEPFSLSSSNLVRVDLARLDDLMRIAGELVIQRSRLETRLRRMNESEDLLRDLDVGLGRSLRELRKAIARVRLVPVGELFDRIPFVVRDLASHSDRSVRVITEGSHTEIDKFVAERLKEPLLHLVRNAFTHGIESTRDRLAAGKPAEAVLKLTARSIGEVIEITVRDDGRGIDVPALISKARNSRIHIPDTVDAAAVLRILCTPGFSTRHHADRAAGRGVGMAVVANSVRELGGTLRLQFEPGHGTEFTLRLPLTLSITDAVLVTVGDESCAVPQAAIEEIVQVPSSAVRTIQTTEVVPHRDGLLPLFRLRQHYGLAAGNATDLTIVVVYSDRGAVGVVVDRVHTRREITIRPLADPMVRAPGFSGATELGDGKPVLILDPVALTRGVVRPAAAELSPSTS